MGVYRGEFIAGHPAFPKDSSVKNTEVATPVDAASPKIEYTPEDDKAIDEYHRQNGMWYDVSEEMPPLINLPSVATSWHSVRVTQTSFLRVTDAVPHSVEPVE